MKILQKTLCEWRPTQCVGRRAAAPALEGAGKCGDRRMDRSAPTCAHTEGSCANAAGKLHDRPPKWPMVP